MGNSNVLNINKFCFIILSFCSFSFLNAEEENRVYLRYTKEIINSFVGEMRSEYGLECYGSGGSMPDDVEKIDVLFIARRTATIEEARKIEVCCVKRLLEKINSHEKIRPFLREWPFNSNRVGVSISFRNEHDEYKHNGSVCSVFLAKNKIHYAAAEMQKEQRGGGADFRDPNNIIHYPIREVMVERLVPLMNEPYEEALKIVSKNGKDGSSK